MRPEQQIAEDALAQIRIMGIVNVTPDSFSDGGLYLDHHNAIAHAIDLYEQGAEILDIGGESTRPYAEAVDAEIEQARVLPVITEIRLRLPDVGISIDTSKRSVAEAALAAGANFVNDVTAFRYDPDMAELVAEHGVDCCLMHMLGTPRTMQAKPQYDDVVDEVKAFLLGRAEYAVAAGIDKSRIYLDPGIGFGKCLHHNLELIARLDEIVALGFPVLLGASRKSFTGTLTGRSPTERVAATVAVNALAFEHGVSLFRVHDVAQTRDGLIVAASVREYVRRK